MTEHNMKNYNEVYDNFKWEEAINEIDFFEDGTLNIAYNMIDRHCNGTINDKIALKWIGDENEKDFTFMDLKNQSNKFANILKKYNIQKGERVFVFLPRVPELYVSVLGTLKAGGIIGTMFPAFQPDGIGERLMKGEVRFLVTNRELKKRVDQVMDKLPNLEHIIVIEDEYEKEMQEDTNDYEVVHMQ